MILWVDVTELQLPKKPVGYRVVITTASGSTYRLTIVEQLDMKEGSVDAAIVKVERERKLPKKLLSLLVRWRWQQQGLGIIARIEDDDQEAEYKDDNQAAGYKDFLFHTYPANSLTLIVGG